MGTTTVNGTFGLDIGGTLTKIVFYQEENNLKSMLVDFIKTKTEYGSTGKRDKHLSFKFNNGTFHFIVFETRRMHSAIQMILSNSLVKEIGTSVNATGGGSYKFEEEFKNAKGLGIEICKIDEIKSLIKGLNFLLNRVDDEAFEFDDEGKKRFCNFINGDIPNGVRNNLFPYLLVNVGTGVSIVKVENEESFQRISGINFFELITVVQKKLGSGLGGGTFWGLAKLLTQAKSFEEAIELCSLGKESKVDMTVGDIYGGNSYAGLNPDMTASFFAKITSLNLDDDCKNFTDADVCKGLLHMVTNNIGQISTLLAKEHSIENIFYAGNFLRKNEISQKAFSDGTKFWSGGKTKALFLKHEGYFGALGTLLS
ncbi:hypothetical protein HDU92_002437 [Lobulomyces angularis]|nr:hypothetical protein HDU92_002437 [Lobulomyces angularis]